MSIKPLLLPVVFVAGTSLGLAPSANAGHGGGHKSHSGR